MRNGGRNKHVRLLGLLACHDWHDWHVLFDFCCFFANYILFFVCIGAFLGPVQDELKYVLVLWSKMFLSTAGADAAIHNQRLQSPL